MNRLKFLIKIVYVLIIRKVLRPNISILASVPRSLKLDKSVKVQSFCVLGNSISIGKFSYINIGTTIDSGVIGKYCSIGKNCYIGGGNHAIDYVSTSQRLYGNSNLFGKKIAFEPFEKPPIIENDVWIGPNSVILQKVHIAHGAIIAAGSIVTKDVPAYAIVAGNPAKIIRYRFDKEKISYLLEWKWWDLSLDDLKNCENLFRKRAGWFSNEL